MIAPRAHIDKARTLLNQASHLLTGEFTDGAGRDAYLAGFHAALAYIVAQSGKEPKTHSGTRSEYARLSRGDGRLDPGFSTFLGRGFTVKVRADYADGEALDHQAASEVIAQAAQMVDAIEQLLSLPPTG